MHRAAAAEASRDAPIQPRSLFSPRRRSRPPLEVGFTFYLGSLVSLGLEYRALPFSWNRSGFDSRSATNKFPDGQVNSHDDTFRFNQLVTVSLGFSFPTHPQISQ